MLTKLVYDHDYWRNNPYRLLRQEGRCCVVLNSVGLLFNFSFSSLTSPALLSHHVICGDKFFFVCTKDHLVLLKYLLGNIIHVFTK